MIIINLFINIKTINAQEVEVDVGPTMEPDDGLQLGECFNVYTEKFPLDFFSEQPPEPGEITCPQINIFNNSFEFCEIVDLWAILRWLIFAKLTYEAILML